MNKTAQSRSLKDRLHEWGNLAGKAQEKLFNPEFEKVMDNLRTVDSDIRSIVAGKSIDGGDPGSDEMSMKDLVKEARKNFNRREYMTAVAYLGRFHKKANDFINKIDDLDVSVNQVHEDFLFKELDTEHKDYLRDLRNRFSNNIVRESLFAQAGIKDLLVNVFSDRGRALAAWEKKYPKQTKKLKKDTETMLNKSDDLLKNILNSLKNMGSFRAGRKPDPYLKEGMKLKSLFDKYHSLFVNYYNDNIKGFLDNQDFTNPPSVKEDERKEEERKEEVEVSPTHPAISQAPEAQRVPTLPVITPSQQSTYLNQNNSNEEVETDVKVDEPIAIDEIEEKTMISGPGTNTDEEFEQFMKMGPSTMKSSDKKFLYNLYILSDESPLLLAKYIKKYANSLSLSNAKSKKLHKLADKIMER